MKLRYTERAAADLEDIQSYIADDSPSAAKAMGGRIREAIELLTDFPMLGRPSRIGKARVLQVARSPYAVYYTVHKRAGEVVVAHIRHGRRRPLRRGEL
jgi:plasmid stabilization system protein ParE